MIQSRHVKTTTHRLETRLESASHGCRNYRYPTVEGRPSRVAACLPRYDPGTDGLLAGSRTGFGASPATTISPEPPDACRPRKKWGGRRRALLSWEEEEAFLAPWVEQARQAGVLVVSPLRAALAEKLGRKIAPSVVYRLLARHGWRKVAPDTRHPKSDPAAQAEWKKNSPKRWQPC